MAMPSFFGSLVEAEKAGERCLKCHWCGGWVWWPSEHRLTEETRKLGRVFHDYGPCQVKEGEGEARAAEKAR